ncbi:hypothetical protein ACFL35_17555 [Candidatus Riflebacteria bacterium]
MKQDGGKKIFVLSRVIDFLDVSLNPILVKEIRQRNRSNFYYIVTFSCLCICFSFIFLNVISYIFLDKDAIDGKSLFEFFSIFLLLPCFFAVPYKAFQAMKQEKEGKTFDLLCLSGLSPVKVLNGKLLTIFVDVLLLFSALSPFIVVSYFFGGVHLEKVFDNFIFILAGSLLLSFLAMSASTSGIADSASRFFIIPFFIFGGFSSFIGLVSSRSSLNSSIISSFRTRPIETFLSGLIFLTIMHILYQYNLAQLKFENDDRSSGIKLAVTLFFLCTLVAGTYAGRAGVIDFTITIMVIIPLISVLFITEEIDLTTRQRFLYPGTWYGKIFAFIYFPGAYRGFTWLFFQLFLVACFLLLNDLVFPGSVPPNVLDKCFNPFFYSLLFYLVIGFYGSRLLPAFWQNNKGRICLILCLCAFMLISTTFFFELNEIRRTYWIFQLLNPFYAKSVPELDQLFILILLYLPLVPGIIACGFSKQPLQQQASQREDVKLTNDNKVSRG